MINRRDAIKRIGGLAGAAATWRLLPGCGSDGHKVPDHPVYVFLMLENRTYDHYFGARSMLEGKQGDGLKMAMTNPDLSGNPVSLYVPDPTVECVKDPDHSWDGSRAQWNSGLNNGFVKQQEMQYGAGAHEPMQYMTRTQLPVSWALADSYAVCDRWFASLMGPTIPNRAYFMTGTSAAYKDNNDIINNLHALPVQSIFNKLEDAGVDWAYYYSNLSIVDAIQSTGQYAIDLGPKDGTGRTRLFQFFLRDAAAGKLPSVCYVEPAFGPGGNDDHPPHHPIDGQELIATVYQALAKSPQWKNLVMLLVTYDEHGGFFDHVSPPTATDDTATVWANMGRDVTGFDQMGFRVPAMIIGPYVKEGWVSSVVYEHTSALKTLANAFGFDSLTARMNAAMDLSDCLDLDRLARKDANAPIQLPAIDPTDPSMWPRAALCDTGGLRVRDPISEWADARPDLFGHGDARFQTLEYRKLIREYLSSQGLVRSRRIG
jgi:phospholipase C